MRKIMLVILFVSAVSAGWAQERKVGVISIDSSQSFDGYTLFNSLSSKTTRLIDSSGRAVNSWTSNFVVGNAAYLLPNGDLLRGADPGGNTVFVAGGDAGRVERFDWEGNLLWGYDYNSELVRHHHDIEPMPNGNVLIIAWEFRSESEAIAAGRNPATMSAGQLWPEHIIEVQPDGLDGGTIVWEWHVWDHLIQDFDSTKANFGVVADFPGKIDINFVGDQNTGGDWLHANSIDYHAGLDQILLNSPFIGEFWVIDHNTTSEEAAGPAGDLLYRWGNPEVYRAGSASEQQLFNQHDARWIDEEVPGIAKVMVFNNLAGTPSDENFSAVDEVVLPLEPDGSYRLESVGSYGPAGPASRYISDDPKSFFASFLSGAQRLPNGNTLICDGPLGTFFEVTSSGKEVWRYVNPDSQLPPVDFDFPGLLNNRTFRATRYSKDYSGILCQSVAPTSPFEAFPVVADISEPGDLRGNVLWLDGDDPDGDGLSGGGLAGGDTWVDKSSMGGSDAKQSLVGNRPIPVEGLLNGRGAMRFATGPDFLEIAQGNLLNGVEGATVLVALAPFDTTAPPSTLMVISTGTEVTQRRFGLDLFGGPGVDVSGAGDFGFAARRLDTDETKRLEGGSLQTNDGFLIVVAVVDYTNGDASLYVDDVLVSRSNTFLSNGSASATDSVKIRIGADTAGGALPDSYFKGDIGELIMFDRTLNEAEIQKLSEWMHARWSAPVLDLESWKMSVFSLAELSDPEVSGNRDDFDGDQFNTVMEFALGGDPKVFDQNDLFDIAPAPGNGLTATYHLRRNAAVHVCLEVSTDLVLWMPAEAPSQTEQTDVGGGVDRIVEVYQAESGLNSRFYRLKVTLTDQ